MKSTILKANQGCEQDIIVLVELYTKIIKRIELIRIKPLNENQLFSVYLKFYINRFDIIPRDSLSPVITEEYDIVTPSLKNSRGQFSFRYLMHVRDESRMGLELINYEYSESF